MTHQRYNNRWLLTLLVSSMHVSNTFGSSPMRMIDNTNVRVEQSLRPNYLVQSRRLAVGDFDSFNQQIADYIILLPDADASQSSLELKITNLECTNIVIGDITSSWEIYNASAASNSTDGVSSGYDETLSLNFDVTPLSVDCSANYEYSALSFLKGSGKFTATSTNSAAQLRFDLNSKAGFDEQFPTNMDVQTCATTINIDNINFDGSGFGSNLLNIAEGLIANIVEGQANKLICSKITTLVPDKLNPILVNASAKIENITGPDDGNDPLFIESNYKNPKNLTLLDFQSNVSSTSIINTAEGINTTFFDAGNLLLIGLEQAKKVLEGTTANGTLKINDIFQNFVNDNGILELNFTSNSNGILGSLFNPLILDIDSPIGTQVLIKGVRVTGLDTIQKFTLLEPIGKYTLLNEFNWDVLKVEVDIRITITPSTQPTDDAILYSPTGGQIVEDATIGLDFKNLNIIAGLFLAIDEDKLKQLQIGSLLDTKYLLPCLLAILDDFQISSFDLSYDRTTSPLTLSGVSNVGVERTAKMIIDAFLAAFEPSFTRMLPKFLKKFVTDAMDGSAKCPDFSATKSMLSLIDFRDLLLPPKQSQRVGGSGSRPYGNVFQQLYTLLSNQLFKIDPSTKLATTMNKLLSKFLKGNSFQWKGDLVATDRRIQAGGLDVNFQLRAYDAYIENIDTMGAPLSLLEPTSANVLNNSATVGINKNLILGISLLLGLSNDETNIHNEFDIRIGLKDLEFVLTALLKISENALFAFPLRDINNFQCWLATIPAPKLDEYGVRLSNAEQTLGVLDFITAIDKSNLNVTCKNCTGPKWPEFTDLLLENEDAVTSTTRTLMDFAGNLVKGEFLAVSIDRALHDAPKMCPHSPQYQPNSAKSTYQAMESTAPESSTSFLLGLLIVCGSLLFLVVMIVLATKLVIRRRHRQWLEARSPQQLNALYYQQHEQKKMNEELTEATTSMFRSLSLPVWIRFGMPLVILGNIGFFLSGHLSLGASVTILVSLGGEILRSDNFFSFSMAKSTIEIWNSGGKPLAILIFLASFAWPYSKSIITLFLWFVPTTKVSVSTRGSILMWLDALAKWSMVDIFVLVVTIVCLRVSINSPDVPYLPEDLYQIDLMVVPKWGLYANMIAQLICQISSHYIIRYHRRIVNDFKNRHLLTQPTAAETFEEDDIELDSSVATSQPRPTATESLSDTQKVKLCDHAFRRVHKGDSDKLVKRRYVSPLLVTLAMGTSVIVILGCILPTFSVNILGLVGVLVESGQGFVSADTSYSMFGVIKTLFAQAELTGTYRDYLGLGTLSVIVVLTVLVVPLVQLTALLTQWFMSLTRLQRKRLSVAIEILQAWQYMEVYLISVVVGSWQLGPISEFMVNPYCESLSGFFGKLVFYGILKEEDAQCLKTDITIKPTFFFLFVAAIVLHLLNTFVMNAMAQYVRDMEENARNVDFDNGKIKTLDDLTFLENSKDSGATVAAIDPCDVLFTDKFRWFLVSESKSGKQPSVSGNNSSSEISIVEQNNGIFHDDGSNVEDVPNRAAPRSNIDDNDDYDSQSIGFSSVGFSSIDLKP